MLTEISSKFFVKLHLLCFLFQIGIFYSVLLGERKVVLATDIAETSLKIDDIHYIIDLDLFRKLIMNEMV
jgi:hypothetical protein